MVYQYWLGIEESSFSPSSPSAPSGVVGAAGIICNVAALFVLASARFRRRRHRCERLASVFNSLLAFLLLLHTCYVATSMLVVCSGRGRGRGGLTSNFEARLEGGGVDKMGFGRGEPFLLSKFSLAALSDEISFSPLYCMLRKIC